MFLHEISQELKIYMSPHERDGIFIVQLVDDLLRDPMTEEEVQLKQNDQYNPLEYPEISLNMLDQIQEGRKFISKDRASIISDRYDGANFVEYVDELYDDAKKRLITFLYKKGIALKSENDLGSAIQDIMSQIFNGLSKGDHDVDVRLTIYDPKPSIKTLVQDRIYFENGKIIIDGEMIELPVKLDESKVYEFESGYISALCAAYADALNLDNVTMDDINNLPRKFQKNFSDQRKAYLSAESIQRSISEVYDDGENQFDILKDDTFSGISTTLYDDYDNGYKRLLEVLKKVSDIQLTKSKLMLIKNLIGNLERLGIIHVLVNDEKIKSWVDPYEE